MGARYDCDVNDVVLAVVAGALRKWLLLSRGEPATPRSTCGAIAPMSVYLDIELDSTGPGQAISEVSPFWRHFRRGGQDRVAAVADRPCHQSHSAAARLVDAGTIVKFVGFRTIGLAHHGDCVATSFSARLFNLFITNVPGAQNRCMSRAPSCERCTRCHGCCPTRCWRSVYVVQPDVVSRRQRRPGSDERSRRAPNCCANRSMNC